MIYYTPVETPKATNIVGNIRCNNVVIKSCRLNMYVFIDFLENYEFKNYIIVCFSLWGFFFLRKRFTETLFSKNTQL